MLFSPISPPFLDEKELLDVDNVGNDLTGLFHPGGGEKSDGTG